MLGDPILRLVFEFFGVLATAFAVGVLLFQFRFRAIWCLIAGEAAILLFYFAAMRPVDPHADGWLPFIHLFVLPALLAPLFGGYYFNKYVIHS
jgi:hypothetical protein